MDRSLATLLRSLQTSDLPEDAARSVIPALSVDSLILNGKQIVTDRHESTVTTLEPAQHLLVDFASTRK